jgi:paraquat-inducible protein B
MNEQDLPPAEHRRSHWPGWIWSVPIAAIGVAVWLGIQSWTSGGPTVEVVFPQVADVKAGDTKVKFQGLDVGQVQSVKLGEELHHMRVKLSLDESMKGHLGKGTHFWIEGAQPSLSNLSSLRAIIGGPSIGVDPANGSAQKEYTGEAQKPLPGFGAQGRRFILQTDTLGSLQPGTPIYYLGQKVGEVEQDQMVQGKSFTVTAFISAAYAGLVRDDTRFWKAGPVTLQTGGTGPTLDFHSLRALVQGAIAFETPDDDTAGPPSGAGHSFTLYDNQQAALYAPSSKSVRYKLHFPDPDGALAPHAAVTLAGTRIGSVVDAGLDYDGGSGQTAIDAVIAIDPSRITLHHMAESGTPVQQVQAMMRHLVAQGLQASLTKSPPLIGGETVALKMTPGAHGALVSGPEPELPTASGGDIAGILAKARDIEEKVAQIPISDIGKNVAQATSGAAQVMQSRDLHNTLRHIEHTSLHLDRVTRQAEHAVPRIMTQLRHTVASAETALNSAQTMLSSSGGVSNPDAAGLPETLYEVSRAARSLRELASFLDQHPQALLTGYHGGN